MPLLGNIDGKPVDGCADASDGNPGGGGTAMSGGGKAETGDDVATPRRGVECQAEHPPPPFFTCGCC